MHVLTAAIFHVLSAFVTDHQNRLAWESLVASDESHGSKLHSTFWQVHILFHTCPVNSLLSTPLLHVLALLCVCLTAQTAVQGDHQLVFD